RGGAGVGEPGTGQACPLPPTPGDELVRPPRRGAPRRLGRARLLLRGPRGRMALGLPRAARRCAGASSRATGDAVLAPGALRGGPRPARPGPERSGRCRGLFLGAGPTPRSTRAAVRTSRPPRRGQAERQPSPRPAARSRGESGASRGASSAWHARAPRGPLPRGEAGLLPRARVRQVTRWARTGRTVLRERGTDRAVPRTTAASRRVVPTRAEAPARTGRPHRHRLVTLQPRQRPAPPRSPGAGTAPASRGARLGGADRGQRRAAEPLREPRRAGTSPRAACSGRGEVRRRAATRARAWQAQPGGERALPTRTLLAGLRRPERQPGEVPRVLAVRRRPRVPREGGR